MESLSTRGRPRWSVLQFGFVGVSLSTITLRSVRVPTRYALGPTVGAQN